MAVNAMKARDPLAAWPAAIRAEFETGPIRGNVGTRLLSETERVRVWSVELAPGERLGFHRHVLDYFWTALTDGSARSHVDDGSIVHATYKKGETAHFHYPRGTSKIHDLENTGSESLMFTTVEFLDSENQPLPV